jgi:hypothetical protein
MVLVLPTLLVAVLVGYLLGGRLNRIGDARLRGGRFLVAAMGLQGVAVLAQRAGRALPDGAHAGLALASLAALLIVAVRNRRIAGMALAGAGVALNLLVIAVNGAMPVSLDALRTVQPRLVDLPGGLHRAVPDGGRLGLLGDVVALPLLGAVISPGDILLAIGGAVSVVALMVRPAGRGPSAARISSEPPTPGPRLGPDSGTPSGGPTDGFPAGP